MPSAWAPSRSPCSRSRFRPRVGKCSTVSMPASSWIVRQAAQALMRIFAMGESATSTTSAPASRSVVAAATSVATLVDRGGSISTATTNRPARERRRRAWSGRAPVRERAAGPAGRWPFGSARGTAAVRAARRSPRCARDRCRSIRRRSPHPPRSTASGVLGDVGGGRRVHDPPADRAGPPAFGPRGDRRTVAAPPCASRPHAQRLGGTLAAVHADRVGAERRRAGPPPPRGWSRAACDRPA